jgi:hypothetical protein
MVPPMARKPAAKRPASNPRRPRGTGASYVHEHLKNQILHLELMPGTLLDETEISKQFGVSRSPVREALIRLSAEGLVQNFRNRTAIVAQFDIANLPAYFDAMQLLYRRRYFYVHNVGDRRFCILVFPYLLHRDGVRTIGLKPHSSAAAATSIARISRRWRLDLGALTNVPFARGP